MLISLLGMHSITVHMFKTPQNKEKPVFHVQKDMENAIKVLLAASWSALNQNILILRVILDVEINISKHNQMRTGQS